MERLRRWFDKNIGEGEDYRGKGNGSCETAVEIPDAPDSPGAVIEGIVTGIVTGVVTKVIEHIIEGGGEEQDDQEYLAAEPKKQAEHGVNPCGAEFWDPKWDEE